MPKPIQRSRGSTETERILARLSEKSFLDLWSYPNVHRDEGGRGKPGKEICDLLVVFHPHVIIFSDKYIAFPDTGEPRTDWVRWFKKAIAKSAQQVYGAERWLAEHGDRVFLDAKCEEPLPIKLPPPDVRKVHRVIVAQGASDRCRKFYGAARGSLLVKPWLTIEEQENRDNYPRSAFAVGDLYPNKGFVHVFDEANLELIMGELDTVTDFVTYLERKERFLRSGRLMGAAGEEELLAFYLRRIDSSQVHDFLPLDPKRAEWLPDDAVMLDVGLWDLFRSTPEYKARKDADRISYTWDRLIAKFTMHLLGGTSIIPDGKPYDVSEVEEGIRVMVAESRVRRRMLAIQIHDAIERAPADRPLFRTMLEDNQSSGVAYVFLQFPIEHSSRPVSLDEYRQRRWNLISMYTMVVRARFPHLHTVVGIATNPPMHDELVSEDLCVLDCREWNDEFQRQAEEFEVLLGSVRTHDIRVSRLHGSEFPEIRPQPAAPPKDTTRSRKAAKRKQERKARRKNRRK